MNNYDDTSKDYASWLADADVTLDDPLDPEQGLRVRDDGERRCACGRPEAFANLNHSDTCACGRPIERSQ